MAKKILKKSWVLILFVSVLLVGTFFDLEISQKLCNLKFGEYYSRSIFGRVFEIIGELPVYILVGFCFSIFSVFSKRKNKKFFLYLFLFLSFCSFFLIFFKFFAYLFKFFEKIELIFNFFFLILLCVFSFVITFLTSNFVNKLSDEIVLKLFRFAILTIIVIAVSNILTHLLKFVFSRERFRTLKFLGDTEYSGFTKWFEINTNFEGIEIVGKDGFRSFPSGHVVAGASVFCLIFLCECFDAFKKKKNLLWVCCFFYVFLVGLSRVVMGAHYFSDVIFGSFLTLFSFLIVRFFERKKKNKNLKF